MKRHIITLIMSALTFTSSLASDLTPAIEEIKLWPKGDCIPNGLEGPEKKSGVCTVNVSDPSVFIYPSEHCYSILLMCPGGGYQGLAMEHEGIDMAPWLNDLGVTLAVLKYRMPNYHSEIPIADAEKAMEILRDYCERRGMKDIPIGIGGASAGGHLASTLATHYKSVKTRPDFQILFYPVISMDEHITHMGSRKSLLGTSPDPSLVRCFNNELHVTSDTPPAFIMASANDRTVPVENSINYFNALRKCSVPAALHIYPIGGHGWGFRDTFPYKTDWMKSLEEWLRNSHIIFSPQKTSSDK